MIVKPKYALCIKLSESLNHLGHKYNPSDSHTYLYRLWAKALPMAAIISEQGKFKTET